LSVEAVHDRLICEEEMAVAVKLVGTVGGVVSAAVESVMSALEVLELLASGVKPVSATWWLVTIALLVGALDP
jgi:hypothetical protein